jgi:MobA/VirD2-like, nuclease domain
MIPKGNQRAGGQQLATHLLNAYDNDSVEIAEVRGAIAQDLHGAFAEWYAEAKATKCRKYLYSLSVNPDHSQGPYTREHYYDFIRRTEERLGLSGQPRALVFHVKHGREHCHVVWSRIDTEKGKAVQISHDHQKLRNVAQQYAKDHNLTLPPGMSKDRGKARYAFRAAAENLGEKQQEERSGISKKERREQITKAWQGSSDARSFVRELEASGYLLARGDQRAYVVVDIYGEIHSLSRQLSGVKAKELKSRLASFDIDRMRSAADAQSYARQKRQALLLEKEKQQSAAQKTTLAERAAQAKAQAQKRRDDLAKAHAARHATLEGKKSALARKHEGERKALAELHAAKSADIARDRAARQPKGVLAFLARVTGFNALTAWREQRQDRGRDAEFKTQKKALARRHAREMEDFKHRERGLISLDKRERRSLETTLRREVFRRIAAPKKEKPYELTPAQQAKVAAFKRTAAEITAPVPAEKHTEHEAAGGSKTPPLAPAFTEAAKRAPPQTGLSGKFNEKAAPDKAASEKTPAPKKPLPQTESGSTEKELTDAQRRASELNKEFNRRAAGLRHEDEKARDRSKHYRRPPPDFSYRR